MKWYEKNNLTCIGVRNADNQIIASVNILPLKKEVFKDIYENRMNEADVVYNQIEEYKDDNSYHIYLSSISIDKKYKNNYKGRLIIYHLQGQSLRFYVLSLRNNSIFILNRTYFYSIFLPNQPTLILNTEFHISVYISTFICILFRKVSSFNRVIQQ